MIESKNTAKSKWKSYPIREGLHLMKYNGDVSDSLEISVNEKIVQFFFCLNGSMNFHFHNGSYVMPLTKGENCFFYNPTEKLSPKIEIEKDTQLVFIFCSLEKIHQLFSDDDSEMEFLNSENANRKLYKKELIPLQQELVLGQILNSGEEDKTKDIFRYAKVLEVLSLYFSKKATEDQSSCPFLKDEQSVQKIKKAKDILLKNMQNPPTTSQLSETVELNEHRLKEGFKSLYGSTLYQYLLDYKMNSGRKLLDKGNLKIKEVAYELGYNNPSHFISAFKKKFGVTPKKYLQSK